MSLPDAIEHSQYHFPLVTPATERTGPKPLTAVVLVRLPFESVDVAALSEGFQVVGVRMRPRAKPKPKRSCGQAPEQKPRVGFRLEQRCACILSGKGLVAGDGIDHHA